MVIKMENSKSQRRTALELMYNLAHLCTLTPDRISMGHQTECPDALGLSMRGGGRRCIHCAA
jgi:hypothetical protein